MDLKECEPAQVEAMSGRAAGMDPSDVLAFFTTDLAGLSEDEMVEFLGIAQGLDLADNTNGIADDVYTTIAEVENFVRMVNLGGAVIPESMNDSSILCPGFTSPGSCESFEQLRRVCPWSCERQKEECSMASPETCGNAVFLEACPVACRQLQVLTDQLPISLEGAIQITSLTDGSAIKVDNLRGTVEEDSCMCFNVFQPVCDEETGEMFANLCEAKCRGPEIRTVPCREESLQAVEAFAATQSSMTQQEIDTMVAEHNAKQETDVTEEEREANSAVNSAVNSAANSAENSAANSAAAPAFTLALAIFAGCLSLF